MTDMNAIVGTHDILMITLDTLRYDAAVLEEANCPNLCGSGSWEQTAYPRQLHVCGPSCLLRRLPTHSG